MKKELVDLLDEVSNPDVIIISSALKTTAAQLLKSINSDALNESPDVNKHEQTKEVCEQLPQHFVSVSLPLDNDIKIFIDYINKYFDWYRNDDLYKNKQTGEVMAEFVIYQIWKDNEH